MHLSELFGHWVPYMVAAPSDEVGPVQNDRETPRTTAWLR